MWATASRTVKNWPFFKFHNQPMIFKTTFIPYFMNCSKYYYDQKYYFDSDSFHILKSKGFISQMPTL